MIYVRPSQFTPGVAAEITESLRRELHGARLTFKTTGATIETTLLDEARRAELKLAYLRAAAAGAFLTLVVFKAIGSAFRPALPPSTGAISAVVYWAVFAGNLLVALRRGVPTGLSANSRCRCGSSARRVGAKQVARPVTPDIALVSAFAVLCVVLAFTGSFRLTRSAVYLTAGLASAVAILAAALGWIPAAASAATVLAVALTGVLGLEVTDMVRRVVTHEAGRVTLDKLYGEAQRVIDAREEICASWLTITQSLNTIQWRQACFSNAGNGIRARER